MAEDNIFAQSNKQKPAPAPAQALGPAAPPAAAPAQAVVPVVNPVGKKSPIGLIIGLSAGALVIIVGIIIFAVVNSNLNTEAIQRYEEAYNAAHRISYSIDSDLYDTFRDAGYSSYYSKEDRTRELQDSCLEKLGLSEQEIAALRKQELGEVIYENEGRKGLNAASDLLESAVSNYENAKKDFGKCTDIVKRSISDNVDVKLGDFYYEEQKYSTKSSLSVTVKNKDTQSHSYSIKIKATSKSGEELKTETLYISDLSGGQSMTKQVFTYLYGDASKYKDATFEVVEIEES